MALVEDDQGGVPASLLIWGLSCKTTFNKELWTSSFEDLIDQLF
jgi:hypothetical protein